MNNFKDIDFDDFDEFDAEDVQNPDESEEFEEEDYDGSIYTLHGDSEFIPLTDTELEACRTVEKLNGIDKYFPAPEDESEILREEKVTFVSKPDEEEVKRVEKVNEETKTLFVDFTEWVVTCIQEGITTLEQTSENKAHVRTYTKKAVYQKAVFKKPMEQASALPKLIMMASACCGTGGFLGYMANSYYVFKKGNVESTFSCAFSWLLEETMPYTITPFHGDVFWTAFLTGFGIMAIIALLIWLDSDAKKQSRVGHEHGNARLGTKRDFKTYKSRFMEQ